MSATSSTQDRRCGTELDRKRQMLKCSVSDCYLDRCVINTAAQHQRSHRGHLTCLSPALNGRPLQADNVPLDPPGRELMTVCQPSIFFPFILRLVQDHGCLAACFTCLTDSSGSGWLSCLTLSWFFLNPHCPADPHLVKSDPHLVTSDPSTWLA